MEPSIVNLNEQTDEATKQMLQHVVDRKYKFERLKKKHQLILWTSILYTFLWSFCLFYFFVRPYSYTLFELFEVVFNHQLYIFSLLLIVCLWGMSKILFDKKEKAEKEFQDLRCEIIDRSKDLWKGEAWKKRHEIFEMMKTQYDINLYHESK
ncbi:YpbF family protein [Bacillus ginsengihumi]|uniref:YpbF family protein n=1 Tax=Heyndrickxia ginsengihumi TaxID=363870 RepID=A0A6M0P7K7_9BACI|nr:YpbF family protein [Heyndrickxia ginsengihumi]NEY20676.1 YpbF family protein [Heyndrickxia ginsengihumi]